MIIVNIVGGLGNQMFQYSLGRSLTIKLNDNLKIDLRNFLNFKLHNNFELDKVFNCFVDVAKKKDLDEVLSFQSNIFYQKILKRKIFKIFRKNNFIFEPYYHYWENIKTLKKDLYLFGYWQSEKYFIDIEKTIRKDFTFKHPLSQQNSKIEEYIRKVNAVSLHSRRGDISIRKKNNFIEPCDIDYYKNAIKIIKSKISKPIFFIFSDDISWIKKNLSSHSEFVFIDHNSGDKSHNDLRLMSLCRHHIISNSTFSWWGAWLNSYEDKIIISPKKWFLNENFNIKDLIIYFLIFEMICLKRVKMDPHEKN